MDSRIFVTEMEKRDIPFLLDLWHMPEVMHYADEFPRLRGWSKSDPIDFAWKRYQEKRNEFGAEYTQLILRLGDEQPIGESFFLSWMRGEPLVDGKNLPISLV